MRFDFLLRTESSHPCRMSWRIIKITIVPWLMKIDVTSCPQYRSKIIGKWQQPKSIGLQFQRKNLSLTATSPRVFRVRRRLGLVSISNNKGKRRLSKTVHSLIVCFVRREECLSKIVFFITMKTVFTSVLYIITSMMDWGYPWESGPRLWNSTNDPSISGRISLRLWRSKTKLFTALLCSPSHAINSIISRISKTRHPGSATILAANLPENILTPTYPVIATEMNIDSLMNLER